MLLLSEFLLFYGHVRTLIHHRAALLIVHFNRVYMYFVDVKEPLSIFILFFFVADENGQRRFRSFCDACWGVSVNGYEDAYIHTHM